MTNFRGKQKHKLLLKQSYEEVGTRTWLKSDFQLEQLETSRNLFENHSLSVKSPIPKTLSVFALHLDSLLKESHRYSNPNSRRHIKHFR